MIFKKYHLDIYNFKDNKNNIKKVMSVRIPLHILDLRTINKY